MLISRISSTSLQAAMTCMRRFKAEHVDRGKGITHESASFGSCVHNTLEVFVDQAYLQNKIEPSWDHLQSIWKMQHTAMYGGLAEHPDERKLGETLLKRWFERGDLSSSSRTVMSVEEKKTFPIKVDGVTVEVVYIRDRLDRLADGSIVVVDYKTSSWNITQDDLRSKIQPAIYALATQIEYPDAPGVWVEFDMLKHENQPIGTYFKREDNAASWKSLKAEVRRILQSPDDPKPTLNTECLFCPVKVTCPAVLASVNVGGYMSLSEEEMVDRFAELSYAERAAKTAKEELVKVLIDIAKEKDTLDLKGVNTEATVTISRRREADADRIEKIIGPDLWAKYGSGKIAMSMIDNLIKGEELTPAQKAEIHEVIETKYGEPNLKAKAATGFSSP